MFEYLMPLLVMPDYDDTLLDQTCRGSVQRQIAYGRRRGVPWGISESCYNAIDADRNYQYRAFGVPGLGLQARARRRPGRRAVRVGPGPDGRAGASCENLERAGRGRSASAATASTRPSTTRPARVPRGQSSAVVRAFMAHHQGMSLLALAQALLGPPDAAPVPVGNPSSSATLLLLQERIPRPCATYPYAQRGRALAHGALSRRGPKPPCACSPPRHAGARSAPAVQRPLPRHGHRAGGGYSRWNDLAVTRWREDPTSRPLGHVLLHPRPSRRGRLLVRRAHQPTRPPPAITKRSSRRRAPSSGDATSDLETHTEIAVSPEDDLEMRRIRMTNRVGLAARIEVTELRRGRAGAARDGRAAPGVQQPVRADGDPARSTGHPVHAPPALAQEQPPWMFHLAAVQRRPIRWTCPTRPTAGASSAAAARSRRRARWTYRGACPARDGPVLDPVRRHPAHGSRCDAQQSAHRRPDHRRRASHARGCDWRSSASTRITTWPTACSTWRDAQPGHPAPD